MPCVNMQVNVFMYVCPFLTSAWALILASLSTSRETTSERPLVDAASIRAVIPPYCRHTHR